MKPIHRDRQTLRPSGPQTFEPDLPIKPQSTPRRKNETAAETKKQTEETGHRPATRNEPDRERDRNPDKGHEDQTQNVTIMVLQPE